MATVHAYYHEHILLDSLINAFLGVGISYATLARLSSLTRRKKCVVLIIVALIKYKKLSTSAQIKYSCCSISPRKVSGIVIYNSTTRSF
jgi:hypothetical protein